MSPAVDSRRASSVLGSGAAAAAAVVVLSNPKVSPCLGAAGDALQPSQPCSGQQGMHVVSVAETPDRDAGSDETSLLAQGYPVLNGLAEELLGRAPAELLIN